MRKHLVCAKCDIEINPDVWDGCEKYYSVDGEIYCAECFREWVLEWIDTDLDEVARVLDVPVVEVRA